MKKTNDGEFLWLVSLSDLMLLLFVFFVMLFSFSLSGTNTQDFVRLTRGLKHATPMSDLKIYHLQLEQWLKQNHLESLISLEKRANQIEIHIKEKVLFRSGSWEPEKEGERIIHQLQAMISRVPEGLKIGIEGYADPVPLVKGELYDGNWGLSAKRALVVLEKLELSREMQKRVVLNVYGSQQSSPSQHNPKAERRVGIKIF